MPPPNWNSILEYLQQPTAWLGVGPMVVGAVYGFIAIGLWTLIWQAIAPDVASARFYTRRNSWWAGIALGSVGVGIFVIFAGPTLLAVIQPLMSLQFWLIVLASIALILIGIAIYRWARNQPSQEDGQMQIKLTISLFILALLVTACLANPQSATAPTPDTEQTIEVAVNQTVEARATDVPTHGVTPEWKLVTATAAPAVENTPEAPACVSSELGPWAPNNGVGEDFEVTANENVSNGVHVQLWWPAGSGQKWDTKEISVFVPAGLSIEVNDGAGRGWEYSLGCSRADIKDEMSADNERRATDTAYFGQVNVDQLIKTGLVTVRFDRREPIGWPN